ncbi:hypothetical protein [Streptomyces sp. NPDC048650]|uniref:hypothetical protein n=1 Tax=Streptomyces sp. NPDC048650 TaxID=3365583 RepID=UPI003711A030
MTTFVCAGCEAALSVALLRVALPAHAHQQWGNGTLLPVLMEPGTYAVDPEPSGLPWRWSAVGRDEAAAGGGFAPASALSFGTPGAIVVAPGDTRGTALIPERCDGYCCGLDGSSGPNLACEQCGQPVATRVDDCSLWQAVWFARDAVRGLSTDKPADWADCWDAQGRQGAPPVDPSGAWSPQWAAAVGAGLAHLLAASEGAPVALPDGLIADTFGRTLDVLLPSGEPAKTVALTGPGLPCREPAPDIFLVPQHPQTGVPWRASGRARTVPLPADVWTQLAFPGERLLLPVTGGLPDGVHRDDPLPMCPRGPFRPDWGVFLHTLARIPAVRQPWLRRIYDRVKDRPYVHPF